MTSFNIYPDLPKEPSAPLEPRSYRLNASRTEREGLLKLEGRYKKKYSKYSKILDRFVWLNACSNSPSVASGMSSVVTLNTFIGLPVSIPLGAVSLAGVATALTKKY